MSSLIELDRRLIPARLESDASFINLAARMTDWPFVVSQQLGDPRVSWAPIVLLIIIALLFAASSIVASLIIGPSRTGDVKAGAYESGMVPVGDTRKRFNVRFYIVAMIFLVFDVEIVFFYPWATIFAPYVQLGRGQLLLVEMLIFVGILLLAYVYAWGKGVFRWD